MERKAGHKSLLQDVEGFNLLSGPSERKVGSGLGSGAIDFELLHELPSQLGISWDILLIVVAEAKEASQLGERWW